MFRRPAIRAEKVDGRRSKWHQGILNERTLRIGERHGSDENGQVTRKIASAGTNAECKGLIPKEILTIFSYETFLDAAALGRFCESKAKNLS